MSEITWTMPVALDLFFAGLAAGLFCFAVMTSQGKGRGFLACSRAAAFLAPLSVAFGLSMLILDLRFKTRFWLTMTIFNGDSPMSLGVWLLTLFSFIALFYALCWVPDDLRVRIPLIGRWPLWSRPMFRRVLGLAGVPVALMVSIYTGVLLSATSIPLWRNPVLPALFCFSSLATGFAAGFLTALLISPEARQELMAGPFGFLLKSYRVLLPAYLLATLAYALWFLTFGLKRSIVLSLITGVTGLIWWLGAVGLGIVFPLVLGFGKTKKSLLQTSLMLGALLLGGFLMRVLLVYTGQEQVVAYAYYLVYLL
jgi:formate-dependent nitrite reductase membrane component NrfD